MLRGTLGCWYHILHTITLPVPVHDQPLSHSPFGGVPGGGSAGRSVGALRDYCTGLVHKRVTNSTILNLTLIAMNLIFLFIIE